MIAGDIAKRIGHWREQGLAAIVACCQRASRQSRSNDGRAFAKPSGNGLNDYSLKGC